MSTKDNFSDGVPSESTTTYFNSSYFPEFSSHFNANFDEIQSSLANVFDEDTTAFATPQSYDQLISEKAQASVASNSGLILGNSSAQYQPYYPTNEEVPITAGLGTELIDWKKWAHTGSSKTSGSRSQTRSQTSDNRTSKNGQTPPTVCDASTVVGNNPQDQYDVNIDLDEAAKEDFTYLMRFKKNRGVIQRYDYLASGSEAGDTFPNLASTSAFIPTYAPEAKIEYAGELNHVGNFAYDADTTTESMSRTQSSIFTNPHHQTAGTAPSVTSYTASSIADSARSERYKALSGRVMPNYPLYLNDDDVGTIYSGFSGHDSMNSGYPNILPSNLQQTFTEAVQNNYSFNAYEMPLAPQMPIHNTLPPQAPSSHKRLSPPSPISPVRPPKRATRASPVKKEHKCTTCHAVFTEKTNLTRHVRSKKCASLGPDMFYCPSHGCTRYYEGRSDNLKTHMKRVHRKEWQKLSTFAGNWQDKESLVAFLQV